VGIRLGVILTVNRCRCRDVWQFVASGLPICIALVALVLPIRVHGQFTGKASATGQFESNSNVFDLAAGSAAAGTNVPRPSDTFFAYGAQFDASYLWGRQQIYATGSTTEYDYQRFAELTHNAYNVDAGLIWKLGEPLDGKLQVIRTHIMAPFYDLTGSALALSLVTTQKELAQAGLKLGSEWRLEGSAYTSEVDEPIQNTPNLQLRETSFTSSIKYLGIDKFTSGLTAGYLSGDYSGSNSYLNPSYHQTTAGILTNYKSNRTTFEGQIGFTRRVSATGSDNTSGLTGLFGFTQQLTPKTSFSANIDREIDSYLLNAGSEIVSAAGADLHWQPTFKLTMSLGYKFMYEDYPGQGNNPVGSNRVDIQETTTMSIGYQPRRWLLISPYANWQTRRSTFIGAHFSTNIIGVLVTVTPYTPPHYTPR
jgi:hypothetical protein